jgi:hypothetical protein
LHEWELYALEDRPPELVFIPPFLPVAARPADWKQAGLAWIYNRAFLDRFFVLDADAPALDAEALSALLDGKPEDRPELWTPTDAPADAVTDIVATDDTIRFRTRAIGVPHIVRTSFFPNWRVRGADRVRMVTPCFLLLTPTQGEVTLYYGDTLSDTLGRGLSAAALVIAIVAWWRSSRRPA